MLVRALHLLHSASISSSLMQAKLCQYGRPKCSCRPELHLGGSNPSLAVTEDSVADSLFLISPCVMRYGEPAGA